MMGTDVTTMEEKHAGTMVRNSYGKSRVRLTKVIRHPDRHELMEMGIAIQLQGEFDDAYVTGDNSSVVATDSMKNTVYVLAAENDIKDVESFGKLLARHFLSTYSHVSACQIKLAEELWQRIPVNGKPHRHAFYGAGAEKHQAQISASRGSDVIVESAIEGLKLAKTTDSAFTDFVRDRYTTLPEAKDRIFGTSCSVTWLYSKSDADYRAAYEAVRATVLEVFANHKSLGVQHTMHEIGREALGKCSELSEITITMPNEHRIPFNLQPFGLENKNEIFITTDEPFGLISATLRR